MNYEEKIQKLKELGDIIKSKPLSILTIDQLDKLPENNISKGEISDGYHTFNELYYHRMVLFSVICNSNKGKSWKSLLHNDGTMYDDYFIVGINTKQGNYTYHYEIKHWDLFNVNILELAPEYDGHKPEDITRLFDI